MSAYPSWPCSYDSIEPISTVSPTKKIKKAKSKKSTKLTKKISDFESIPKSEIIISLDKFLDSFKSLEPLTVNQVTYEILADYNIFENTDASVNSKDLVKSTCELYGIDSSLVESILVQREPGSSVHKITIQRLIF